MAVYTDVAAEELAEFLESYDIGELLSYKGIAEGVENSNFLLHTSKGAYILTLYEKRVAEDDLPYFLVADGASGRARRQLPAAGEKPRRRGVQPARRPAGRDHQFPRRRVAAPAECRALRGRRRSAGQDASGGRRFSAVPEESRFRWPAGGRCSILRRRAPTMCRRASPISSRANWTIWKRTGRPICLKGVIHADLFPDNVFFLGDRLSGLIDFPFACNDILAYDVAICLNAWCFEPDHSFNVTKARALLNGYGRERALSEAEQAALPLLARGAALRFLLTRLVDFLNVPKGALVKPKDPLEYVRKLRFQQSVKTLRDYGVTQPGCVA